MDREIGQKQHYNYAYDTSVYFTPIMIPQVQGRPRRKCEVRAQQAVSTRHGMNASLTTAKESFFRATGSRPSPARVRITTRAMFLCGRGWGWGWGGVGVSITTRGMFLCGRGGVGWGLVSLLGLCSCVGGVRVEWVGVSITTRAMFLCGRGEGGVGWGLVSLLGLCSCVGGVRVSITTRAMFL